MLGVSPASIANYELDRCSPSAAVAAELNRIVRNETAKVPLSASEERMLDEAVRASGFESRQELLEHVVVRALREGWREQILAQHARHQLPRG